MNKMKHRFSKTGVNFGKNDGMLRIELYCSAMEDGGVDTIPEKNLKTY
jgi:hypothetical protein